MLQKSEGLEMQFPGSCLFPYSSVPLANIRKQATLFSKATPDPLTVLAFLNFLEQLLGPFFMLGVVGELYR
jgi:hypothetical protein